MSDTELPVGTILRNEDSSLWEVFGGILAGGGYYLIRSLDDGQESRLQPGRVGGIFTVVGELQPRPPRRPDGNE